VSDLTKDDGEYVLLKFGDDRLALTSQDLDKAKRSAALLSPMGAQSADVPLENQRLLTAEEIARLTKVPASWWLEAARQSRVPHVRIGKYVRFRLSEALEALQVARKAE